MCQKLPKDPNNTNFKKKSFLSCIQIKTSNPLTVNETQNFPMDFRRMLIFSSDIAMSSYFWVVFIFCSNQFIHLLKVWSMYCDRNYISLHRCDVSFKSARLQKYRAQERELNLLFHQKTVTERNYKLHYC